MSADCLLNERETALHCTIMRLWVLMTSGCHSECSYTDATHFQAPFIQLVGLQCYQSLARVLRHHLTGPYQAPLSRVLLVCFVSPTLCLWLRVVGRQVYQSLDRELQKHVSHQDTLQQSQTWLSAVQEELQLHQHQPPSGLQEALKQVPPAQALTHHMTSPWNMTGLNQ